MLNSLLCPLSGREVPLEEAPHYFEEKAIAPAEATAFFIRSERPGVLPPSPFEGQVSEPVHGDKTFSSHLSPSSCMPTTICLREQAIKRALPYSSNSGSGWMANEGTALWTSLKRGGGMPPPYGYELHLPGSYSPNTDRVEVLPGWATKGTIDRLFFDPDTGLITDIFDIKTKRPMKNDRGLESEWQIQMNVYARLCRNLGLTANNQLPRMWIWRIYRGASDARTVFRKLVVPPLDDLQLEGRIGKFVRESEATLAQVFDGTDDIAALRQRCAALPMDGEIKQMFGGKKCEKYCSVTDLCYDLAGKRF